MAGGVAVGLLVEWLGRRAWVSRLPPRSAVAIVVLAVAVSLAIPVTSSLAVSADFLRPDTRDIARAWMLENVPRKTTVAREIYTPLFDDQEFTAAGSFFLHQVDLDGYRAAGVRYLIASSWSYERFVDKPGTPREDAFYKSLFGLPEAFRADAGLDRNGPTIRIFRLD